VQGQDVFLIPDRHEAIAAALHAAEPGDMVLLLGKGHEGSIIYAHESLPWDESQVARDVLGALGYQRTEG
jgi:UDP-N-acetylmuramoyl-L-alanyl-D-glutamate--2,6-diaminopimelate ligase